MKHSNPSINASDLILQKHLYFCKIRSLDYCMIYFVWIIIETKKNLLVIYILKSFGVFGVELH